MDDVWIIYHWSLFCLEKTENRIELVFAHMFDVLFLTFFQRGQIEQPEEIQEWRSPDWGTFS